MNSIFLALVGISIFKQCKLDKWLLLKYLKFKKGNRINKLPFFIPFVLRFVAVLAACLALIAIEKISCDNILFDFLSEKSNIIFIITCGFKIENCDRRGLTVFTDEALGFPKPRQFSIGSSSSTITLSSRVVQNFESESDASRSTEITANSMSFVA